MSLTNSVRMIVSSVLTGTVGQASIRADIVKSNIEALATATKIYTASGALTGGAAAIDLSGSLTDPIGNPCVFTKVQALYFKNTSAAAMTLFGGANNVPITDGTTDSINLAAGASIMLIDPAGVTVTAGTGDLITVAGTGSGTFEIIVIGQ